MNLLLPKHLLLFPLFTFLILFNTHAQVVGSTDVCENEKDFYSVTSFAGATYSWDVTGGAIIGTSTQDSACLMWGSQGTGTIIVTIYHPDNSTSFETLNVTINPLPAPSITPEPYASCPSKHEGQPGGEDRRTCDKVCKGSTLTYSTDSVAGSTYLWVVSGASSTTSTTLSLIEITWDNSLSGEITLYETNSFGCTDSTIYCVEKEDLPVAAFTHQLSVCLNADVAFNNLSSGASDYFWDFGDGGTSTDESPVHSYSAGGSYTVTLIVTNDCYCTDTFTSTINVNSDPGPTISCPSTVCAFDEAIYTADVAGCTYNWFVTGGTISGSNTMQDVTVDWGPGQLGSLGLLVSGCGGVCTDTTFIPIAIVPAVGSIDGPNRVCAGDCAEFTLPPFSGAVYNWSLSGSCGQLTNDSTTCESVEICYPPSPGFSCTDTLHVTFYNEFLGCEGEATKLINLLPALDLYGNPDACADGTSNFGTFYGQACNWTISPAGPTIGAGPSPTTVVNWNGFTGTYLVKAVINNPNTACNDSAFFEVNVALPPPPPVITGDTLVCTQTPYSYCASGTENINWIITGGTPSVASGDCVNIEWNATGPYLLQAYQKLIDAPFCNSIPDTLSITPITSVATPTILAPDTACANGLTLLSCSTLYPSGSQYTWTIAPSNAGAIISGQGSSNIQIEWGNNAPNTVTVSLEVTVCGLSSVANTDIFLKPVPDPVVTQLGPLCQGGTTDLEVTGGIFSTYSWNNGGTSNPLTITNEGIYSVTAVDANGCEGIGQITVDFVDGPNAFISTGDITSYCIGDAYTVEICALGNANYEYLWSTGDITQCINVSTTGTFNVVITDTSSGCFSLSNDIDVVEQVCDGTGDCKPNGKVTFTHTDCNPISFTNTSSGASNFLWTFGDGNSSTATNPTHSYTNAGFYLVTLFGDVPNTGSTPPFCRIKDTAKVHVPLAANFDIQSNCLNRDWCFTDASTTTAGTFIIGFKWDFGDGNISTLQNPCHQYNVGGSYDVSLIITDGVCVDTIIKTIDVPVAVTADLLFDSLTCSGQNVLCTDASFAGINKWDWMFGDGGTSLNQNPTHYYGSAGTYPIQLIVEDTAGCKDTTTENLTVVDPVAYGPIIAEPDTVVCAGEAVTLIAPNCTSCSYSWSTGSTNDSITVTETSIYTLIMEDSTGCSYSTFQRIIVNPLPEVTITSFSGPEICVGSAIQLFVPYDPNYTYLWMSNEPAINGQTFSSVSSLPVAGTYTFQVIVGNTITGCIDTSDVYTVIVHTNPSPPTITALSSTTICAGETVVLVGDHPNPLVQLSWSTGEVDDTITVTENGCIQLTATDENGCESTATECISVSPLPDVCSFYSGCFDTCAPYEIAAPMGGTSYQWFVNGNPIAGATNDTYIANSSGVYNVEITNIYGCTDTTGDLDLTVFPCNDSLCAQSIIDSIVCDSNGQYLLYYRLINNSDFVIDEYGLLPVAPNTGVGITPALAYNNVNPGDTSISTTAFISNVLPGETICFRSHFFAYDSLGAIELCCQGDTNCIIIPACESEEPGDICGMEFKDSIQFNNNSNFMYTGSIVGGTYSWTFVNGSPGSATGPGPHTINYTVAGCHEVLLVVSDASNQYVCKDTICVAKEIVPDCEMDFDDTICTTETSTFTYTGGIPGTSYSWTFINGSPPTATGPGPHSIIYTTPGCHPVYLSITDGTQDYSCEDTICVFKKPFVTVDHTGGVIVAGPKSLEYQWYEIEGNTWKALQGEDNQYFHPESEGRYGVVGTTPNSDCKDSASTDYTSLVNHQLARNWRIYPNPNSGAFTLELDQLGQQVDLVITDAMGRVIDNRALTLKNSKQAVWIQNEKLVKGLYFVTIRTEKGMDVKKFSVF